MQMSEIVSRISTMEVFHSGPMRMRTMPTQMCELCILAESWGVGRVREGYDVSKPWKDRGCQRRGSVV